MRTLTAASLIALSIGGPVLAQDDWDAAVDPTRELTIASTTFDNGLTVAVRCVGGRYDALIAGLPPAPEGQDLRTLRMQFGEEPEGETRWNVATDRRVIVHDTPARFARQLREGGRLQIVVAGAGEGGANLRYVLDLPASGAVVDRTLAACDRPTVDTRDAEVADLGPLGLPGGVRWARPPRPEYPGGRTYVRGFAVISCLNRPDGRLRDCVIESEHPLDGGFGEAALDATRRGRVESIADPTSPMPARMIVYRTNFRMGEVGETQTGSRIPRRD